MCYESAELAKIAINCCLVASIGVANTLGEICEKIGANWGEIAPALKLDKRIGSFAYLSPGLGIAGGNLERDLTTVLDLSQQYGTETSIVEGWLKNSRYRRDWALRTLYQQLLIENQDAVIAVLGLAYKENTHSTKNSPALALLACLQDYRVKAYDPAVTDITMVGVTVVASAEEAMDKADVLIIMTPWPEFKRLDPKTIARVMKSRLIIDPYQVLNAGQMLSLGFNYFCLGSAQLAINSLRSDNQKALLGQ
jgi:UDPglucose 6-dehydrogenase